MAVFVGSFVVDPRLPNLDRPYARSDRPRWQIAVADHQAVALVIAEIAGGVDILSHFVVNGLGQHFLCSLS